MGRASCDFAKSDQAVSMLRPIHVWTKDKDKKCSSSAVAKFSVRDDDNNGMRIKITVVRKLDLGGGGLTRIPEPPRVLDTQAKELGNEYYAST
eukprot:scaffold4607_cov39-Cyclotella_meneghiniana.AAC.5